MPPKTNMLFFILFIMSIVCFSCDDSAGSANEDITHIEDTSEVSDTSGTSDSAVVEVVEDADDVSEDSEEDVQDLDEDTVVPDATDVADAVDSTGETADDTSGDVIDVPDVVEDIAADTSDDVVEDTVVADTEPDIPVGCQLEPGDLFQVPGGPSIYVVTDNYERMYFPTGEVFNTWFEDYSTVVEISELCVDYYPEPQSAPHGVNYRPGSVLVKTQTSPKVYAIGLCNTKYHLISATVAADLYGADWGTLVVDVADVFWPNYVNTGADIQSAIPHDGMLITAQGSSNVYYVENQETHLVNGTLPSFVQDDVREVTVDVLMSLPSGSAVDAHDLFKDPTQLCN